MISKLELQLIFICGRNEKLARALRVGGSRLPRFVEGFTKDVNRYMHLADFFIGKPGPGSVSEALAMQFAGDCGAQCVDFAAGTL